MRHFIAALLILLLLTYASQTYYWKKFSCEKLHKGKYLWQQTKNPEWFCRPIPIDQGEECRRSSDCQEICNSQTKTCDFFQGKPMQILNEMGEPIEIVEDLRE